MRVMHYAVFLGFVLWLNSTSLLFPQDIEKKDEEVKKEEVVKEEIKEEEEVEEVGIDTIDIDEPQGNWLFKRIWWEKAEKKYEKIKNLVGQTFESRMIFYSKRTELDKTVLDPFYRDAGLGQGELREIISYIMSELEKEREEEGVLSEQERELLNRLRAEQRIIEQLGLDIQAIGKVDDAIDDALMQLIEQINRAIGYEKQAWQHYKKIAKELNDKKAKELYYTMDTLLENVRNIKAYVADAFTKHFEQLSKSVKEQIEKAKSTLKELKQKGIDLRKEAERLEEIDRAEEREQIVREREVVKEPVEKPKPTPGWLEWLWNSFTGGIKSFWSYITGAKTS